MKKVFALMLTLAMVLSLAACGGGDSTPADNGGGSSDGGAASGDPVKLTVAYADPETSVFGKGAAAFAEKLEELSGGSMTCTMYPNGTLGSIPEVAAMIQQGTCDVSPIVTSSLVDFCPELGVFDLPFLFADYDEAREIINGEAGDYLAGKMAEANMHVGSWMTMGFRETTSKKPITSIADFRGLKIRTQSNEVHQAIFSALGAAPTIINFSELYTAMEQSTVDAQENPITVFTVSGFYEAQKYMTATEHVYTAAPFIINKSWLESLPEEYQTVITSAAAQWTTAQRAAMEGGEDAHMQTCKDNGMEIRVLTPEEKQVWMDAATALDDLLIEKYGAELLELARSFNK